jgi:hypothetical protein
MCFLTASSKGRALSDIVRSNKSGFTDMFVLLVLSCFLHSWNLLIKVDVQVLLGSVNVGSADFKETVVFA